MYNKYIVKMHGMRVSVRRKNGLFMRNAQHIVDFKVSVKYLIHLKKPKKPHLDDWNVML